MREILFRGKRIDGLWVEGAGITVRESDANILSELGGSYGLKWCQVYPSTVGQYTGLTANGKKIFEGDVVQYYGTYALEVFIEKGHTKIRWFDTVTNTKCEESFFGYDEEEYGECEVIGNIHDNPELLEVSHE